jgi:hypothetical protein
MHWQNNWFCSPSFDDKTMQKCLWCTAIVMMINSYYFLLVLVIYSILQ